MQKKKILEESEKFNNNRYEILNNGDIDKEVLEREMKRNLKYENLGFNTAREK